MTVPARYQGHPMTPAAWLCIGFTIGAALAAIAGWAAR